MRWEQGRRSSNVEDRRGRRVVQSRGFKGGIGTIIIALVASYFLGINPATLLNSGLLGGGTKAVNLPQGGQNGQSVEQDQLADMASAVLAGTEDTWSAVFRNAGQSYQPPKLVLFSGGVQSACGTAQAAMGPFYCSGDRKIYLDLGFYHELKTKMGAPGDFAQAYVIAHEVGHHVQNLLGISGKVHAARKRVSKVQYNELSVRLELQADCFAGIWANHADVKQNWLEKGDIEEALNAARQIGDDTLQKKARGYAVPDSFTHGTSAQRMRWFRRGYSTGDLRQCDTFNSSL